MWRGFGVRNQDRPKTLRAVIHHPALPSIAPTEPDSHRDQTRGRLAVLSLGALGVVYGDIGTSPLYALRESLGPEHHLALTPENVLGILSLIVWSLILLVAVKYVTIILRADNDGEGGILALMARQA